MAWRGTARHAVVRPGGARQGLQCSVERLHRRAFGDASKWGHQARRGRARPGRVGLGEAEVWHGLFSGDKEMAAVLKSVNDKTNGGASAIESGEPYAVALTITGSADLLFHRWNCEAVEEKAKAAKNSKAKKTDDIDSYVWRNDAGELCLPGEYLRQSIIHAAKFRQDPRSPRKSAMDLFKAGVVSLTNLASLGTAEWDYLDTRRVTIQRAGVNRTRPAMRAGWKASLELQVLTPEYIDQHLLMDVLQMSGRLVGVGDFRPTFGRFNATSFQVL